MTHTENPPRTELLNGNATVGETRMAEIESQTAVCRSCMKEFKAPTVTKCFFCAGTGLDWKDDPCPMCDGIKEIVQDFVCPECVSNYINETIRWLEETSHLKPNNEEEEEVNPESAPTLILKLL